MDVLRLCVEGSLVTAPRITRDQLARIQRGEAPPTPKPKRKRQRQITTDEAKIHLALRCRQDCEEGARLHRELVRATSAMCEHIEQHRRGER